MAIDRIWFVYRIYCKPAKLAYYGSTSNPTERWHQHKYTKSGAPKVRVAREMYGADSFDFEIIAWFDNKVECLAYEKQMIREHDTVWPNGLNVLGKGRGTLKANMTEARQKEVAEHSRDFWGSEENKDKHKAAMLASESMQAARQKQGEFIKEWGRDPANREKRRQGLLGHETSAETRKKIGDANRGRKRTPEQIEASRLAHLGYKASEETKRKQSEAMKGKSVSADARAKISRANKGKKRTPEQRARMSEGRKLAAERRKMLANPQGEA